MQCNSCGAELPPEARNCPNCGTAVFAYSPFEKTTLSSPGMQPEGTRPATSYTSGSSQEMAWPPRTTHHNDIHATATAQTQQTIVAQTTATAYTQATGTAVAISHATATAQAQVTATATALQNIYTSATKGSPILDDSLSFNTGSSWEEDQAQGGGGCGFTGGAYHASID